MADISVNIRGRDDGLGQQLDSLRQKAAALGTDVSKLNNISSQTNTQQKQSIENAAAETLRAQRNSVKSDYQDIRNGNNDDYQDARNRNKSGKMSDADFGKFEERYRKDGKDLDSQEKTELRDLDKSSAQSLRLILKELQESRKIEQEVNQRDNSESQAGGAIGGLLSTNRGLRNQQNASSDDAEIAALQGDIDENNSEIKRLRSGDKTDEEGGSKGGGAQKVIGLAGTVGSGDLVGSVMKAPDAMESLGLAKDVAMAGGLITATAFAAFTLAKQDENLREKTAPLAAMRGIGGRAGNANDLYRGEDNLDSDGLVGDMGLDLVGMMGLMTDKANSSKIGGSNLRERAMSDLQFQKGFGSSVDGFSQFERFGGGDSSKVGLDILNVLTSISESSLKSDDLITLSEKISTGQTIMSLQRQKTDSTDTDGMLRLMAGFEAAGLSAKGEKSADFMSQTINGLGEGGGDNVMMLKFEAMKAAHPDKANNPAALRKMIKYHSDDPTYIMESLKQIQKTSGGNEMAEYDMMQAMFPGLNEKDMEIYRKAGKSGNVQSLFKGNNLGGLKARKAGLDEGAMQEDARSGVGNFTQAQSDFKNSMTEISTTITKFFTPGGPPMNVAVVSNTAKKPTPPVPNSKTPK